MVEKEIREKELIEFFERNGLGGNPKIIKGITLETIGSKINRINKFHKESKGDFDWQMGREFRDCCFGSSPEKKEKFKNSKDEEIKRLKEEIKRLNEKMFNL
jgi:hypothetical protein